MKKNKLLLILALIVALTMVFAACGECSHEVYGEWKITKAPTADAAGEAVRICAECQVAEVVSVAKLTDTSVWTANTATAGKTVYTSIYGTITIDVPVTTPEHTHTFGDWKITVIPTVDVDGQAVRLCSGADCDSAETMVVAKLSNTDVWTVVPDSAIHSVAGATNYSSSLFGTVTATGTVVSHVYDKEVVAPEYLATAATCSSPATYHKSCACGMSGVAVFESGSKLVDAGHSFTPWNVVTKATCTEDGSESRQCSLCQKVETHAIDALGHTYVGEKYIPAPGTHDISTAEDEEIVVAWALTHHTAVCDRCNETVTDTSSFKAHTFVADSYTEKDGLVYAVETCSACNYKTTSETPVVAQPVTDADVWTAGTPVAATYGHAGYIPYTLKADSTVVVNVITDAQLVIPFNGKTYVAVEIRRDETAERVALETAWDGAAITIADCKAIGDASPFRGNVEIVITDEATRAITLTVTNGSKVDVYNGFFDHDTGIIVIPKTAGGNLSEVYVVTPYEHTIYDFVGYYWATGMAIEYNYTVDGDSKTMNMLVVDNKVLFNVTFSNEAGTLSVGDMSTDLQMLIVRDASNNEVAAFGRKLVDGTPLIVSDGMHGAYTAADGTTDLGTLLINGAGLFMGDDEENSGLYTLNADNTLDAYIIDINAYMEGKIVYVKHMTIALANGKYTITMHAITITLDAGDKGTIDATEINGYTGCPVGELPVPTTTDSVFLGWGVKASDGSVGAAIDANTTFNGDVTIAAIYAKMVVVNVSDAMSDNASVNVPALGAPIINYLPKYVVGETINSANNTIFGGWCIDADFTMAVGGDDELGDAEDNTVTIYAKWTAAGAWTIDTTTNLTFAYDAASEEWKNNNQGQKSTNAIMDIVAVGGPILVSFDYRVDTEGSDKLTVRLYTNPENQENTIVINGIGGANKTGTYSVILTAGQRINIVYNKDSSVDSNTDTVYISNLVINGRAITKSGTVDFLDGTYTCAGSDDLVLDGYGHFTWNDKAGTYTKTANNTFDMYVVDGGANVEYYVLTLDGTTYSVDKIMVDVSYNFGELETSFATANVNKNVAYTLPAAPEVDGYVFRGWYDNADLTGSAITSVVPTADTVIYAKYDAAATIVYNYMVDGIGDKTVTGKFVNDTLGTVEAIGDVTNGSKVFVGWFTNDGSVDGDWGDKVTASTVLTAVNTTFYAQWAEPHALMGSYIGANLDPAESGIVKETDTYSSTVLTIDELGNVTGWKSGKIEDYDAATGKFTLNVNGSKYYGAANVAVGVLYIDYASSKTAPYHDIQFFGKTVGDVTITSTINNAWDSGCTKLVTITYSDDSVKTVLIRDRLIHSVTSWTASEADGTAISDAAVLASKVDLITITLADDTTLTFAKLNNNLVLTDGTQGTYTLAGSDLTVILNGAGGINYNGKTGTLTAVEGQDNTYVALFSDASYTLTIDVTNKTYTIADRKVNVSYNFGSLDASLTTDSVYAGVAHNLPAAPDVAGYVFRGWYDNAGLTGTAITKVTPNADTVIYAKYDKAITVTLVYGNGMENSAITDKFANDTVTVTLPADKDGFVAEGWYTTATFDADSKWTSGSKVTDDLTLYCKWVAPHALTGYYKGYESYNASVMQANKILEILPTGVITSGSTVTGDISYDPANNGVFTIGSRYAYVDIEHGVIVTTFGGTSSDLNNHDLFIFVKVSGSSASISGVAYFKWNNNIVQILKITVDNVEKYYYINDNRVYGDVTVVAKKDGADVTLNTNMSSTDKQGLVITISRGDEVIGSFGAWNGTTFFPADGTAGTYTGMFTGDSAATTIISDGYGLLTIGADKVSYTVVDGKLAFVHAQRSVVIELTASAFTPVQDGYQGVYTLPDNAGTITLDGLGGAGDGATYVVDGASITIYKSTDIEKYGIDVDNKTLLGKSIFAGLTFEGTYRDSYGDATGITFTFDDSALISGSLVANRSTWKFEAVLSGNTITFTIVEAPFSPTSWVGKTLVATIEGNTMTFNNSGTVNDNAYRFYNAVVTCDGFSL